MKKQISLVALFALASCSGHRPASIATSVFCTAGDDCATKWARAVKWVKDTSAYDIASQTDTTIATVDPMANSPVSALSASITPTGHGLSRIVMQSHCDYSFQCSPTADDLQAQFVHAVDPSQNSSWPNSPKSE